MHSISTTAFKINASSANQLAIIDHYINMPQINKYQMKQRQQIHEKIQVTMTE
jgi:hypothetical protein